MFMTSAMLNCVPGTVDSCLADQDIPLVRFEVLMAMSMKIAIFKDVVSYNLEDTNISDEFTAASTIRVNLSDYTVQHPRRQPPSRNSIFIGYKVDNQLYRSLPLDPIQI
jgi:hypothetical protein